MTLREGYTFSIGGNDDDDESDEKKTAKEKQEEMKKEINDAFDAEEFREKAKKLIDLYEEIEKTQGKAYIGALIGMNKELIRDIDYVKNLWDEEKDEWKKKAYEELAESKFKKYNLSMFFFANIFDEIIEKAETDERNKEKYDNMKEIYGKTGITYIKRIFGIVLDKDMDFDMDMDMGALGRERPMDMDLGQTSMFNYFG